MFNGNSKMSLICQNDKFDLVYNEYYEEYQILFKDGWEIISIKENISFDALKISKKIFKILKEEI